MSSPPSLAALCANWQAATDIEMTAPLSSLLGNALAGRDILSVGAISFPPFVGGTASYSYEQPPFQDPLRPTHGEPGLPDAMTGWSGRLLIDGKPVMADKSRWCADKVDRATLLLGPPGLYVHTSVSLAATNDGLKNSRGILFEITIDEVSGASRAAARASPTNVSVEMQGIVRKFIDKTLWKFGHPTTLRNETSQFAVSGHGTSGVSVADTRSPAATAFMFTQAADSLVLSTPTSAGPQTLVGGRADFLVAAFPFKVGLALAIDESEALALAEAQRLSRGMAASVEAASALWRARWRDAFTPGNRRYSGHLPTMSGDRDVGRIYYNSVLSFLSIERRVVDPSVAWAHAYTTGGPRTGVTSCYYWDQPYQSTLLSLLDPLYVRRFYRQALANGLNGSYEISYFSGKGEGRWYAFNSMSLFTLATVYVKVTGDVDFLLGPAEPAAASATASAPADILYAAATSASALASALAPTSTPASVPASVPASTPPPGPALCSVIELATQVAADGPLRFGLSDFGGNLNLLECVPQYQHGVPALNAANAWMRLELANLLDAASADNATRPRLISALASCGHKAAPPTSAKLRSDAKRIAHGLMQTYVAGASTGGVWRSVQPDGSAVAVRTIIDFHTIGALIGAPAASPTIPAGGLLTASQRSEMASFFGRELAASGWARALSLSDAHANVSSFRPDHGTIGSYDAWPAQSIEALVTLGYPDAAMRLLRSVAGGRSAVEGPFGQAHTLFESADGSTRSEPPRLCNASTPPSMRAKCVPRKSQHWVMQAYNAAGAAFANVVLRATFGFQPALPFGPLANSSAAALLDPRSARGFEGALHGLSWRGALWTLTSSPTTGLSLTRE